MVFGIPGTPGTPKKDEKDSEGSIKRNHHAGLHFKKLEPGAEFRSQLENAQVTLSLESKSHDCILLSHPKSVDLLSRFCPLTWLLSYKTRTRHTTITIHVFLSNLFRMIDRSPYEVSLVSSNRSGSNQISS